MASTVDRVHARAPGKINVYFRVGGLADDGYHPVASVYQAVSLYEDVWATPADGFTLSVTGSVELGAVPRDDTNLALRAARLLAREIGIEDGVHLQIHKTVPVAGGMGGGSADAAAALVACDALWAAGLSHAELMALAAQLGADVPFALMGGTAVGTGHGDQLNPALAQGRFDWVLAISDEGLSTPAVYAELDEYRLAAGPRAEPAVAHPGVRPAVLQALRQGDARRLASASHNDLDPAALRLRPPLDDIINLGLDEGALTAFVSGSGPTIAMLAEDERAAIGLQISLSTQGHKALHVHGPVPGARVVAS
ncbi:4-(cytidine 5'-diphospho)-2-C-methyl-D-erythritol kinase [Microbacterium terrisoli]|jgi:4-diphosphocytidyl-2-C-methyl-D-erythritol kinase|uniref:4-(cytidine 5'-diphospho)-2-C-methyl-D-erythritol kinase n=1 Tax=Microbacterium terrisoli TaxID=3242192 RepID=UPI002804B791|nr:4-(cytidine 5'-diphospho)-2-C-methyl-D-erythritol kinase [Microbacterium protaetiae]